LEREEILIRRKVKLCGIQSGHELLIVDTRLSCSIMMLTQLQVIVDMYVGEVVVTSSGT